MAGLLLLIVLLAGPVGGVGWPVRGATESPLPTPLESFGVAGAGHAPIALTGPRSIAMVAGLNEARPRAGQFVEPAPIRLASGPGGARSGLTAVTPRPPYLTARGLLAVRAPPA